MQELHKVIPMQLYFSISLELNSENTNTKHCDYKTVGLKIVVRQTIYNLPLCLVKIQGKTVSNTSTMDSIGHRDGTE